ncbi:hypothetical protein GCM10007913_40020 [Devosia yakushimensis]|uniref:Uncharacterized protein n=1 Tax=Devosia yakushimensis TaxID=470028 RepID=A0ABQ5ULK6_9HYPH|nr:hypothetical protein [Devosia yakushimensis]GLQ12070.1 hypothetical protein GCM10007913_40020 [Devosia yakushimensis]
MNLKKTLGALVAIILEEAGRNPDFKERIEAVLQPPASRLESGPKPRGGGPEQREHRKGGRRAPATLDPIDLVKEGEPALRARLADLDLERLLDVVAQYGMDPGKLVMKWKDRDRVIDRIVEVASARATKGDSFRKE